MVRPMFIAALAATTAALSIGRREAPAEELFTLEFAPGETQVVTEEEKWALKNVGSHLSFIALLMSTDYLV